MQEGKNLKLSSALTILAAALAWLPATSCKRSMTDPISSTKSQEDVSPVEAAWRRYFVDDLKLHYPYELQEDCKPVFARANPAVPYVGTAIFFHGYTACPQQFFEMRDYLTSLGFNVLIPLLPGQGRGPAQLKGDTLVERQSYYQYIPNIEKGGTQEYEAFVDAMNAIMQKANGLRVVGGLSVGGALAYRSVFAAPGLYERALILAPFLTLPPDNFWRPVEPIDSSGKARWNAFYANAKLKLNNDIRKIIIANKADLISSDKQEVRWGDQCYKRNIGGRAGICDTNIRNIAATIKFGEGATALAAKQADSEAFKKSPTQIQIVAVEFDDGSDTRSTKDTFRKVREPNKFKNSLCFYRGTPHSFLARQDHPGNAMNWLPHFHDRARKFLLDGQFFDTEGPSRELVRDPSLVEGAVSTAFPSKDANIGSEEYFDLCRQS